MPGKRSPFTSLVEPISPPPKPASRSGLWWRRRVPPPGPKDLFRCPFIAIAVLVGRRGEYRGRERAREEGPRVGIYALSQSFDNPTLANLRQPARRPL